MKNLSPEQKRIRIRTSFRKKIDVLWTWAKDGVPDGVRVPTTRTALRRWENEEEGLLPWSDDAVDSPTGRNADLAKEFEEALAAVRKRQAGTKSSRLSDAASKVTALKAKTDSLTRQNASLIARIDQLECENARLMDMVKAYRTNG